MRDVKTRVGDYTRGVSERVLVIRAPDPGRPEQARRRDYRRKTATWVIGVGETHPSGGGPAQLRSDCQPVRATSPTRISFRVLLHDLRVSTTRTRSSELPAHSWPTRCPVGCL
jgi:hypothetical protein